MEPLRKLSKFIANASSDESFLSYIKKIEGFISKALSIAMIGVLLVAVVELFVFLANEIFTQPYGFSSTTLIEVFGLFLNILIALEVLENITAYLRKHVVQVELVIVTSLVAVARKIIILDFSKTTGVELIGLAIAIIALSLSYWIIRYTNRRYNTSK
jgi:uncharacterized membrane protein (DUF373 family)